MSGGDGYADTTAYAERHRRLNRIAAELDVESPMHKHERAVRNLARLITVPHNMRTGYASVELSEIRHLMRTWDDVLLTTSDIEAPVPPSATIPTIDATLVEPDGSRRKVKIEYVIHFNDDEETR